MSTLDNLRWFLVFTATADRWLESFEADGWQLHCGNPAYSSLVILPLEDGPPVTLEDARWLADACAFDHDAPVGIFPAMDGDDPPSPLDPAATPPVQPIHPFEGPWTRWYWDHLNQSYLAAAELRFNGSCVLRYGLNNDSPSTAFSARFAGQEELVSLYAMAARQADPLSEYLCLYRVLEAADKVNGKAFAKEKLPTLMTNWFGDLRVIPDELNADYESAPNAFEIYRERAQVEMDRLSKQGVDIPAHLYAIRNALAHGKRNVLTPSHVERVEDAAASLPIVKLLARMAVEP